MTVDDKTETKDTIKDGIICAARSERGDSHRNKGSGEKTFKSPVVGTMGPRWRRERGRVIRGALVDCFTAF